VNIDGHEIERHADGLVYVDDDDRGWKGDNADDYARRAEIHAQWADRHRLVGEFVRREAAEKAAADAARELDRRARLACETRFGPGSWDLDHCRIEDWRNVVRALDADATEQEA